MGKENGLVGSTRLACCCFAAATRYFRSGLEGSGGINMVETAAQTMHDRGIAAGDGGAREGRGPCRAPKGVFWRSGVGAERFEACSRSRPVRLVKKELIRAGVCCGSGNSEAERGCERMAKKAGGWVAACWMSCGPIDCCQSRWEMPEEVPGQTNVVLTAVSWAAL
jgi:hypothetical protein